MKRPRIAFIGLGQIANAHLREYRTKNEPVDIVAACDFNAEILERVCDAYEIPDRYTDFRELLARDDIDAVDVCLHNNLHAPATIEALRSGKHVYCEKPIAGSYADGVAMVAAAAESGKMLHVQLSMIYTKEARAAKELIENQALGRIYHVRSSGYRRRGRPYVDGYGSKHFVNTETSGGGALFDMGVYHISQLLYLLGQPVIERITGKTYQEIDMYEHRRQESSYNVEELGLGFVRFQDGVTMDIIESWAANMNPFESSSLFGSKGGIRLDPFAYFSTVHDLEMNASFDLDAWDWRRHSCMEDADVYDSSIHHWAAALQGRVDLLPTAQLALDTMLIQEGIYLSNRLGREVTADEVREHSKSTAVRL